MEHAGNSTSLRRFAGWAALISAGLAIVANVFLILFFAVELPSKVTGRVSFGTINDTAIIFEFVAMVPLPLALHQLAPPGQRTLSTVATVLGLVGMSISIVAQALLVAGVITFSENLPYLMAGHALFGAWVLIASSLGRASGAFTARLARLGKLTGVTYLAAGIGVLAWFAISALSPDLSSQLTRGNLIVSLVGVILGGAFFLGYVFGLIIWLSALGRWLLGAAPTGMPASLRALS